MTTSQRTGPLRSRGRRLVGALSAGAAVAVMGIGAVPAGTAAAAGLHRGHVHVAAAPSPDPADLPREPAPGTVLAYRIDDGARTLHPV